MRRAMYGLLAVSLIVSAARATTLPVVGTGTLKMHLDADSSVVSDGTGVLNWTDISGAGINYTRASGNATLVANAMNGQAVIRFTGSSGADRYAINSGASLAALSGQPFTFFAVTQGGTNLDGLFETHSGSPSNVRFAFGGVNVVGSGGFGITGEAAGSVTTLRSLLADDPGTPSPTLVGAYEGYIHSNSNSGFVAAHYTASASLSHQFSSSDIGHGSANQPFTGDIAEIVVYQGALSDQDRMAVLAALANSYGLPPVPEPSTALVALGSLGCILRLRRTSGR